VSETALRYIKMLQLVPKHPRGITVVDLHAGLLALEFVIDKRGVERDLNSLSGHFPITNSGSRPAHWHWAADSIQMTLPGLDPATALTYELVSRHLAALLPRRLLSGLEPQFAAARQVLNETRSVALGRWSNKIAVTPDGQPLLPPDVAADVTDVVHEALLANRRFEVSYRAIDNEHPKRYPLNPLGLVLQGGALYLVATAKDYVEPRIFALHRMSNPKALQVEATVPDGFDLSRYVREQHAFEHPQGDDIRLELRITPWLARQLGERRLASDQTLTPMKNSDQLRLRATVTDTGQLLWWLRSFGVELEVLKPLRLRRQLAAEFATLTQRYAEI
jgi:predicted DNA-binding transcriptional regulator YafY